MYAIFETGGKQYKVSAGDVIRIEKIAGDVGDKVKLGNVIAFSDGGSLKTGTPYLDAATVNATIVGAGKGEKVIIFKFKAKKDYRRKRGHRQPYTELEIDGFTVDGKKTGEKPKKVKEEPEPEAEVKEEIPAEEVKAPKKAKKAEAAEEKAEAGVVSEEAAAEAPEEKPTKADEVKLDSMKTKADIMAELDKRGIEYKKSAKKDELQALLDGAGE